MTLLLLGLTVVSLLLAFSTSISASALHRNLALNDTVLRSVSESVVSQFAQTPTMLQPCATATPSYYNSHLDLALPSAGPTSSPYTSYTATVASVGFWTGSGFPTAVASCIAGRLQQLDIQVLRSGAPVEDVSVVVGGFLHSYSGTYQLIGVPPTLLTQSIVATVIPPTTPWTSSVAVSSLGYAGTGAITYSLDSGGNGNTSSGVCHLSGKNLTASGAGACYLYASIAADSNYASATSPDETVVFTRAVQSITVNVSTSSTKYTKPVTVGSSGSSGTGAITYALDTGANGFTSTNQCSLSPSGTTLTASGPGTCYVFASIAADSNYSSATSADKKVTFSG